MWERLREVFGQTYMPHGHCFLWTPELVWSHAVADLVIALSYYSIPITLAYVAGTRKFLPFRRMFWLFSLFIAACGTTHLVEVWNLWHSDYAFAAGVKIVTAAVSSLTAVLLVFELPKIIRVTTPSMLAEINALLAEKVTQGSGSLERSTKLMEGSGTAQSTSEKRFAEASKALLQQLRLLDAVFNTLPLGVAIAEDPDCKKVRANKTFAQILGMPSDTNVSLSALLEERPDAFKVMIDGHDASPHELPMQRAVASKQSIQSLHETIVRADGQKFDLLCYASPVLDEEGNVSGCVGVFADISAQKKLEQKLAQSVRDKEILIREVHHRVKNNLQVISSLLRAQQQSIKDPEILRPFEESQRRLRAISLVHQKLYRSDDLEEVMAREYLEELTNELIRAQARIPIKIVVDVSPRDLTIPVDTMIPLGLIVNELFLNALKHAFEGAESGKIEVYLTLPDNGTLSLQVSDNGKGMEDFESLRENAGSLGWRLIRLLSAQLDGKLALKSAGGFTVTVDMPMPEMRTKK